MFSDEVVVEIDDHSFFVPQTAVRTSEGNRGEVLVSIVDVDGRSWAVMPTSTRETLALGA